MWRVGEAEDSEGVREAAPKSKRPISEEDEAGGIICKPIIDSEGVE